MCIPFPLQHDIWVCLLTHSGKYVVVKPCSLTIDDSPFRQTFEVGIFISTAEENILNLVTFLSLFAKHRKI